MSDIEAFRAGSKVVHIGPPKTGTSTLQGALHAGRAVLAEHGAQYAGSVRHSREAATFGALERVLPGYSAHGAEQWDELAAEVRDADARVVITSSESYSRARKDAVHHIVEHIGGRAQVVVTARPLASMLASMWQQRVRNGETRSLQTWLEAALERRADGTFEARSFWARAGIDRLVTRWSRVVGEENVTVIVLDPGDRSMLLRSFDALLGLPDGALREDPLSKNESMPSSEVETLRWFNTAFDTSRGSRAEWVNAVRRTALRRIRDVHDGWFEQHRVETPRWAADVANGVAQQWIDYLVRFSGRVIGDPQQLVVPASRFPERPIMREQVSTEAAGRFALLMYQAARDHHAGRSRAMRRRGPKTTGPRDAESISAEAATRQPQE